MNDRYVAHEETRGDLKIKIIGDTDASNPREDCDNAGTMVCFHSRYELGDNKIKQTVYPKAKSASPYPGRADFSSPEDFEEYAKTAPEMKGALIIPLFLYDHSGITIKAGSGFSCPWDSGQVGWIYATRATMLREWGNKKSKHLSKKTRDAARACLVAETENYADYLEGNCYGFQVEDEDGEHLDSCWGFLGDPVRDYDNKCDSYVLQEARAAADCVIRKRQEAAAEVFNAEYEEAAGRSRKHSLAVL